MSKKALKTQLMAAIAMVLVAAIALSSSTYAWFAQNNTVKATTAQVTAVSSDPFLYIAYGSGVAADSTSWKTADLSAHAAEQLNPCTSNDGVNFAQLGDQVAVTNLDSSVATWSGTSGAFQTGDLVDAVDHTSEGGKNYKLADTFSVINKNTTAATDLYVKSVAVEYRNDNMGDGDMSKAIRVAVTMGSTTLIFNPNSGTNNSSQVGGKSTDWALVSDSGIYTTPNTAAASLGSLAAATSTDVVVTLWFEGQDSMVYTSNIDTDALKVNVELTIVAPTTT